MTGDATLFDAIAEGPAAQNATRGYAVRPGATQAPGPLLNTTPPTGEASSPVPDAADPRGWTHCRDCGRRWKSKGECHCAKCHHQFSGESAFSRHERTCPRDPGSVTAEDGRPMFRAVGPVDGQVWE